MNKKTRELTESEIKDLVKIIGAPTYKYMMKRIQNNILLNDEMADISINSFIAVLIISLSTVDANALRWIEKFYQTQFGEKINFQKLRYALNNHLNEQLNIGLH